MYDASLIPNQYDIVYETFDINTLSFSGSPKNLMNSPLTITGLSRSKSAIVTLDSTNLDKCLVLLALPFGNSQVIEFNMQSETIVDYAQVGSQEDLILNSFLQKKYASSSGVNTVILYINRYAQLISGGDYGVDIIGASICIE